MTIDEAKVLLCQMYLPHFDEQEKQALTMAIEALEKVQQYEEIGTVEGYEKAIQATTEYYLLMKEYKSKVQDFEAIGTIDEFKALKEKNNEHYSDIDELDGYGYGCTNKTCNERIRAKAIDEFAEMLKEKYEEHNLDLCLRQNDYYSYANSCIQLENYIDKIAEQMKAGADNE